MASPGLLSISMGPLQVWPMVYILYLFVARGHCSSVYILIQLLLTLLILVLSYRHITTLDLNHFFPVIIIPHFGRIFSKILTSWSRSSWGCGGHWTQFPVPPGVSSWSIQEHDRKTQGTDGWDEQDTGNGKQGGRGIRVGNGFNPTLALPSDTPLPPNLSLDSLKQQLTIYRDIEKGLHTNKGEGYPSNTAPSVPTNRAPVSKPPIEMFCIKCGTNFLFFLLF